ncbi:MAG: plasmid replication/partition related protein, partial [Comamonas sp.]
GVAVGLGGLQHRQGTRLAQLAQRQRRLLAQVGDAMAKQAAKRVRDAKKKPKAAKPEADESAEAAPAASAEELQSRVTELEAENERLRMQVKTLQELLAEQV